LLVFINQKKPNNEKKNFDTIFIIVSAIILIGLIEFDILEKYIGFSLIRVC